jgi:Domain of unknown function (DUF4279)
MAGYFYRVIFRIRHPSIDPSALTRRFAMKPSRSWKVGKLRRLPNGRVLKTRNRDSLWSYSEDYEGRSRKFLKRVERLANRLKRHKTFLHEISASGGQCEMYVQLPGAKNTGDSVQPATLRLLAELNILLSIEVFPDWRID